MEHPRILLFEPDRQKVDDFRDIFVQSGFETEVALNREVALSILSERKMNILLIDAAATGKSCPDLVREFHELDAAMLICVVNGKKDKTVQRTAKKLGAVSYLSAPTDGERAFKTVTKLIAKED